MWYLFSFLAAFCAAIADQLCYQVVNKYTTSYKSLFPIYGLVNLICFILIIIFYKGSSLNLLTIIFCLIIGFIYFLAVFVTYKALTLDEVSIISAVLFSSLIFVTLGDLFFGQILTKFKYLGIILIFISLVIFSLKDIRKLHFSKGVLLAIVGSLLAGLYTILTDRVLSFGNNFWAVSAYTKLGVFISALVFSIIYFREFKESIKKFGAKTINLQIIANIFFVGSETLFILALSIGFASLASAIYSIQPFIVFAISLFLSLKFPHILQENLDKQNLIRKISALVLLFCGIVFITLL
ncbi:MAG: hypothetical protein V1824_03340 [archaeon]